jgi:predicted NAD-dependent protein-ADP-ribosyltransferase YbiA (DUF1768 family)
MYCIREKDKWYCISDTTYSEISSKIDGYMSENVELYKKYGKLMETKDEHKEQNKGN